MSKLKQRPSARDNNSVIKVTPQHRSISYAHNTGYESIFKDMLLKMPYQDVPAGAMAGTRPLANMTDYTNNAAIALLDSWSVTNDILSFYQERLLNEGYLSSVHEDTLKHHILSLVGYCPSPSVAANVYLAFQTKPSPNARTVIVPKGLQVESMPTQQKKAITFETDDHAIAHQEQNCMKPALDKAQVITSDSQVIYVTNKGALPMAGDLLVIKEKNNALASDTGSAAPYCTRMITKAERFNADTQKLMIVPFASKAEKPKSFADPALLIFSKTTNLFGYNAPDFTAAPSELKRKYGFINGGFYHYVAGSNQWMNLNKGIGNITVRNMSFNQRGYGFLATDQGVFRSFKVNAWGSSNKGINTTDIRDITSVEQTLKSGIGKSLTFAATDQGVYISENYGMQWRSINTGLTSQSVLSLAAHALSKTKSFIVAGTEHGAFCTDDEGKKWHACHGGIEKTSVHGLMRHGGEYYAATSDGVFHSSNGRDWGHYGSSLKGTEVRAIAEHGNYFFAATANGVFRRYKLIAISGPWELMTKGMKNLDIKSLTADKSGNVYAGTAQGLYCSTTHGDTWFSFGFEGHSVSALNINLDGLLFAGTQHAVIPAQWPNFTIQNNQIDLPRVIPGIIKGQSILLNSGDQMQLIDAKQVAHVARKDYMLKSTITRITPSAPVDPAQYSLRDTVIYYSALQLSPAREPLAPTLSGNSLTLNQHISTLKVGQKIALQGHMPTVTVHAKQKDLLVETDHHEFFLLSANQDQGTLKWVLQNSVGEDIHLNSDEALLSFIETKSHAPYIAEIVEISAIQTRLQSTDLIFTKPLQHQYDRKKTSLCGNIVPATQGKTIKQVLGSGNNGKKNQRFTISHQNVLNIEAGNDKGYESSLRVYVNDILWTNVESLYSQGIDGTSTCYMTGRDENGRTFVIFGDGHHGALLPTGKDNIIAFYKTGNGADGNLAEQTLSSIKKIAPQPPVINAQGVQSTGTGKTPASYGQNTSTIGHLVRTVTNPLPAQGGTEEKAQAHRHDLIPLLSVQSLKDVERLALQVPSINLAEAIKAWDSHHNRPLVLLNVAGAPHDPTPEDCSALSQKIKTLSGLTCAVKINVIERIYFALSVTLTLTANALKEEVIPACRALLRAHYGALPDHVGNQIARSDIIALLQAQPEVASVTLQRFCLNDQADDVPPKCQTILQAQTTPLFDGTTKPAQILLLSPNDNDLVFEVTSP